MITNHCNPPPVTCQGLFITVRLIVDQVINTFRNSLQRGFQTPNLFSQFSRQIRFQDTLKCYQNTIKWHDN